MELFRIDLLQFYFCLRILLCCLMGRVCVYTSLVCIEEQFRVLLLTDIFGFTLACCVVLYSQKRLMIVVVFSSCNSGDVGGSSDDDRTFVSTVGNSSSNTQTHTCSPNRPICIIRILPIQKK
uniref:Uncharacterized protein n=1 Tax=Octopus bimaculoides TaxID=37653 RepID=A0A0L8HPY4_OCTBM